MCANMDFVKRGALLYNMKILRQTVRCVTASLVTGFFESGTYTIRNPD